MGPIKLILFDLDDTLVHFDDYLLQRHLYDESPGWELTSAGH